MMDTANTGIGVRCASDFGQEGYYGLGGQGTSDHLNESKDLQSIPSYSCSVQAGEGRLNCRNLNLSCSQPGKLNKRMHTMCIARFTDICPLLYQVVDGACTCLFLIACSSVRPYLVLFANRSLPYIGAREHSCLHYRPPEFADVRESLAFSSNFIRIFMIFFNFYYHSFFIF